MGHDDYTELMSAALDGRLDPQARAAWSAHLAACPRCQARWASLQAVDRLFKNAAHAAPAPGFAARFARRLTRPQAVHPSRQQSMAGAGVLGASALAALLGLAWLLAWQAPALSGAPAQMSDTLQSLAQWFVLIRALGETGLSVIRLVPTWGFALAFGYASVLAALAAVWSGIVLRITGQTPTLAISRAQ